MVRLRLDLRDTLRQWRRRPLLTSLAALSLALATGANTTFFTLVDAIMLRPISIERPDRLVAISEVGRLGEQAEIAPGALAAFGARQHSLMAICGYAGSGSALVEIDGVVTHDVGMELVTGEYFSVLGLHPRAGRFFERSDVGQTAATTKPVAVISYRFWVQHFHGDPQAIGRSMHVEGLPFTIIGVAPESFRGMQLETATDIVLPSPTTWAVAHLDRQDDVPFFALVGRLRDDSTRARAAAEIAAVWPSVMAAATTALPTQPREAALASRPVVTSAATGFSSSLRVFYATLLRLLNGLAAWMIVVACANVAGVVLAAAIAREREFGVRVALGASRADLVRQLFTESALLCLTGAAVGLVIAVWGAKALFAVLWVTDVSSNIALLLDWRVWTVTVGVTVATTFLVGLAPAWWSGRAGALAASQQTRTISPAHTRIARGLLVGQLALAFVLIVGAGLFVRTLVNLRHADTGFDPAHLLLAGLQERPGGYDHQNDLAYYPDLAAQLSAVPGITSVAFTDHGPFLGVNEQSQDPVGLSGTPPDQHDVLAIRESVSPGFFRTFGLALIRGRDFGWSDTERTSRVGVLSAGLAAQLFPAGNAVGRELRVGSNPKTQKVEVIGVVSDMRLEDLRVAHPAMIYLSSVQDENLRGPFAVIRTAASPSVVTDTVRHKVESLGHEYVESLNTFAWEREEAVLPERLAASLGACFGALAMLLATVGVYGVIAHSVSRRTRELGIRLALGAVPRQLRALVMWHSVRVAVAALVIGLPMAVGVAHLTADELYGVTAHDPMVFMLAVGGLLGVALVAAHAPARRASRIQPTDALRTE